MIITIILGSMVVGAFYIAIGFSGLTRRRPFVVAINQNIFSFINLVPLFCVLDLVGILITNQRDFDPILDLPIILVSICVLFITYEGQNRLKTLYLAVGVTDESFRTAVHASLNGLQIPFEEKFSCFDVKGELVLKPSAVRCGSTAIQALLMSELEERKQKKSEDVSDEIRLQVKAIFREMNNHFIRERVKSNIHGAIVPILLGAMLIAVGVSFWGYGF